MAVNKTVLKATQLEAVVKVEGTAAAATIDLDVDLVAATEAAGTAGSQLVNIAGVMWTGATGAQIQITRDGVIIATLQAAPAGYLDFAGQSMINDNIENDQNIVVTISGAQAECWLKLRKVAGYNTKIQPEQFGAYDDPTSTTA